MPTYVTINCPVCKLDKPKYIGHINRANKMGARVYCSKACSGIARRYTVEQKKAIKRDYDKQYRADNLELLKKKHHEYFKKSYDPQKAAVERKKRMPKHVEYCRQPEYKVKKKKYDARRRDEINYGEYSECFRLILEIESLYSQREAYRINQLYNKAPSKRKRTWKRKQNNQNLTPRI